MCEAISIATGILSTASSLMQKSMQGKAQSKLAAYNAQIAEEQAATQRKLAQNEIQKGITQRERQQRNALRDMGTMRSGMGASGFAMDSGTNLSLLGESATEHQYDSNMITQDAEQAAWQHLAAANTVENEARLSRYKGQQGSLDTNFDLTTSLLGDIGSFTKAKGKSTRLPTSGLLAK